MKASETIDEGTAVEGSRRADRRRHRRCPCHIFSEGVVRYRGSMFRGEILDISESGCFLMTKAHLNLERYGEVDLHFKYRNVGFRTVALAMDIQPGKGVGLEFSFADAQTAKAFLALCEELNAAAPLAGG
jgi:hypothetical protein